MVHQIPSRSLVGNRVIKLARLVEPSQKVESARSGRPCEFQSIQFVLEPSHSAISAQSGKCQSFQLVQTQYTRESGWIEYLPKHLEPSWIWLDVWVISNVSFELLILFFRSKFHRELPQIVRNILWVVLITRVNGRAIHARIKRLDIICRVDFLGCNVSAGIKHRNIKNRERNSRELRGENFQSKPKSERMMTHSSFCRGRSRSPSRRHHYERTIIIIITRKS